MDKQPETFSERASRLAMATGRLAPRAGFDERVVGAVLAAQREIVWFGGVVQMGKLAMIVAAATAAVVVALAVRSEQSVNTALAASYGEVELEW